MRQSRRAKSDEGKREALRENLARASCKTTQSVHDQRPALKENHVKKNSIKATILDITKGGLDERIARRVNSIYTTNIIHC